MRIHPGQEGGKPGVQEACRKDRNQAAQESSCQEQRCSDRRAEAPVSLDVAGVKAATGETHSNALGIYLLTGSIAYYRRSGDRQNYPQKKRGERVFYQFFPWCTTFLWTLTLKLLGIKLTH